MAQSPTAKTRTEKGQSAKGQKSRAGLKAAALQVMEEVGYHRMRVADVTAKAGVASGLFYHYFKDLKSLTLEVLEDFVSHSLHVEKIEKDVPAGDWYERMLAHNRLVVNAYAEQPGIMRCLLQLADEEPQFAALLRDNFVKQLHWLIRQMSRLFPEAKLSEEQALLVVYTLAGTGETILRDYYVNREPALVATQLGQEEMAELLTVVFYRGLFLTNPPAEKMHYTAALRQMTRSFS